MISISPLRYPGGKTRFRDFISEAIKLTGEKPEVFVEPFCGGAGAAISLLEEGTVERIAINDIDPLVSSFWKVVFGKNTSGRRDINWLLRTIENAEISIDEWRRQKALKPTCERVAAWKCLFLNRTSFNGIIHKAGPIGGWGQKQRKLDVRFNRDKLIQRLEELFQLRHQVEAVGSESWKHFCMTYEDRGGAYLYLDPPYYHRAEQLYGYLFDADKHCALRNYLVDIETPWMLSYDDSIEVRALYVGRDEIDGRVIDQTYSTHPMGGASFVGRELVFSNRNLPKPDIDDIRPHVGMTIRGNVEHFAPAPKGPVRTRTRPISTLEISNNLIQL